MEPYKKILIWISTSYQAQVKIENEVIKKLSKVSNTNFIGGHEIFLPTREYSDKDMVKAFKENEIEAVLYSIPIELSTGVSNVYIPTFNSTTTSTSGYVGTNSVNLSQRSLTSSYDTIQVYTSLWRFKIEMVDLKTGKKVFFAESTTTGHGDSSMMHSLIKAAVSELRKSELIQSKENNIK